MSDDLRPDRDALLAEDQQEPIPYKRSSLDRSRDKWLVRFLVLLGIFFIGCLLWRGTSIALGDRTQGTITTPGQHGVCNYMFQVDGRWYFGAGKVPFDYKPHPIGSPVEVRYARFNPDISTIEDPFFSVKQLLFVAVLFGSLFLVWYLKRKRRAVEGLK